MTDFRNSALRARDLRRLIEPKLQEVAWDEGVEKKNEWIYASLDGDTHRAQLLAWLHSKAVDPKEDAICIRRNDWNPQSRIYWADIVDRPADFFGEISFTAISLDLHWALEYMKEGVARFGRWHPQDQK